MRKNQVFLGLVIVFSFFVFSLVSAVDKPSVSINKGIGSTNTRKITLYLKGSKDVKEMRISNVADFSNSGWESFKTSKVWYLEYGSGYQTVYVRFKTKDDEVSSIYRDSILLSVPSQMSVDFEIKNQDDDGVIKSRYVNLELDWTPGVEKFRISNSDDFSESGWMWIEEDVSWILTPKSGNKEIYVQFKDAKGDTKTIKKEVEYKQPGYYIEEGTLLKGQASTIYYLGFDGKIHPFFNGAVYHSWYPDFTKVKYVSNSKLSQYKVGSPVCVRQGSCLVKFKGFPDVYAVEPGCQLRLLRSEAEATLIYGKSWVNRILELDLVLKGFYKVNYPELAEDGVDKDKDGVDKETEEFYNTSDSSKDSDSDGLSDYEEIFYWFSDPIDDDSDNDNYKDGLEVVSGFSPIGINKIKKAGDGTYVYAKGTLIKSDSRFYYRNNEGVYKYVSKKTSDSRFKQNNFQSKFAVISPIKIPFEKDGNVNSKGDKKIYRPQVSSKNNNLIDL